MGKETKKLFRAMQVLEEDYENGKITLAEYYSYKKDIIEAHQELVEAECKFYRTIETITEVDGREEE